MRTFIVVFASITLTCGGLAEAQDARGPVVPVTVRCVHVQVDAATGTKLQVEGSLAKLQQQALKEAQSQSASVQRSFLVSTLTGYDAMAQTGRQVQVVTGRTQARDRVMEQTQNVQIGTLLKVDPDLIGGQFMLELTYESSSLAPSKSEKAEGDDQAAQSIAQPDIRTLVVQTTMVMQADQPQLIKLQGDSDVDYLIVTASWDAQAASRSSADSE